MDVLILHGYGIPGRKTDERTASSMISTASVLLRAGDLVFEPRGVPHAFWNASEKPARALEIISPAGFVGYFAELALLFPPANQGPLDEEAVGVPPPSEK